MQAMMKNRWLLKLLGAFLIIVMIGGVVASLMISKATRSAFDQYTTRSGNNWAQRVAPWIADYYAQNTSWDGISEYIQTGLIETSSTSESENTMMGQGNGHGPGGGMQSGNGLLLGTLDQRLILVDSQNLIVYDSQGEIAGQTMSSTELANGTPVLVEKVQVGTLLVTSDNQMVGDTPASEFLTSVQQAIIGSSIIAAVIALILGILLSIQITAPMRKLRKAAAAISNGDLTQRVDIKGKDEFGEMGQTFNKMAENLALAETQRQHLMADVAHELRTPLTAIQGTLEAMQDGVLPCDKDQLDALYSESALLNRLIGDLRLLSLAEAKQLKLELIKINTGHLIRQITDRAQSQARVKNIHLDVEINEKLPDLWLDPDRIAQVVNNLISNALRYTPEEGTITVEVSHESKQVRITVTDTGYGIAPENLPYVFDRFYRADKSRTRSSGGSGLGLAIVKELVEAHGAVIRVESPIFENYSHEKYGTKFIMDFPVISLA